MVPGKRQVRTGRTHCAKGQAAMATVLLVDDDADLIEVNKLVLTQRGYTVRTAGSAGEARAALAQAVPDAVVLDIMMESDSAGIDLAQEIHAAHPGLPLIALSSVNRAKGPSLHLDADDAFLPVTKFVDKPVDPAKLCLLYTSDAADE